VIGYLKKRGLNKLRAQSKSIAYNGLANAKSVLILFRNDTPNKVSLVLLIEKMLEKYTVNVVCKGFVNQKLKKDEQPHAGYFFKNNLNWLGIPEREMVKNLTLKPFDVIIDLDEEIESPNNFILLSATAGLKVGVTHLKPNYDLVVEKANFNEEALVKEMEHFLVNITKN
jgi:Family of unknown function (DUF6913)